MPIKYPNYEKLKITCNSEWLYIIIALNVLLFGKKKLLSFEILCE